jgi:hypothetical protein
MKQSSEMPEKFREELRQMQEAWDEIVREGRGEKL